MKHNSINISRNFTGAAVGTGGSFQCQIVSCFSFYLFSRSVGSPQIFPALHIGCFNILPVLLPKWLPLLSLF